MEPNQLVKILESSRILRERIPDVRRMTLIQTLKLNPDPNTGTEIFLQNIGSSPYFEYDEKIFFTNLVIDDKWSQIKRNIPSCYYYRETTFLEMVTAIFSESKKIKNLSEERKLQLQREI